MIQLAGHAYGPIGVDLGSRSLKLVQLSADGSKVVDAGRWDFPREPQGDQAVPPRDAILDAIRQIRDSHRFKGRDAVLCLTDRELFVQSIRVPKLRGPELERAVQQEAAGRIPFPVAEADIRFLEAADVQQSDSLLREVILLACHLPPLREWIETVQAAGLRAVAVDAEPLALLRCYVGLLRREEDRHARRLYVQLGHRQTLVVIADGEDPVFIKYIEIGGKDLDEAIASDLNTSLVEAAQLRIHDGDRRNDRQDADVARIIEAAQKPVVSRLAEEMTRCVRYHSVTFRGRPLDHVFLSGGEATPQLAALLAERLAIPCDLGNPLRNFELPTRINRPTQWDIATGLALRNVLGGEATP